MEKYVDCHNCQNQYDCEKTYLGGCTDGKEWEQEEKKLTDEEVIKAFGSWNIDNGNTTFRTQSGEDYDPKIAEIIKILKK